MERTMPPGHHAAGRREAMSSEGSKHITFESEMPVETAIDYLEKMLSALKAGSVSLEHSDQIVTVQPGGAVHLAVAAKSKKSKESIGFELKWRRADATDEKEPELRISDGDARVGAETT
jgi:amphi-Trp domain-containing protein